MIFFFLDTYGLFGAEIELWCECCYLEGLFFKAHNLFGVCPTGIFSFGVTNDSLCVLIFCFDFDTHFILFSELVCAVNASSVFTHCLAHLSSCLILKCFKEMYYIQKDYNIMLYGVARFFLLVLDPNRKFYIKCCYLIMSS